MTGGPERSDFSNDKDFVDALLDWIVKCGANWCYDEQISQLEHAVQSAVLARSTSPARIEANAKLFDFELSDFGHRARRP